MNFLLAQCNFKIGDLIYNTEKIKNIIDDNKDIDLLVFSELAISGYPPLDLIDSTVFIEDQLKVFNDIVEYTTALNFGIVIGFIDKVNKSNGDFFLYNSLALIYRGEVLFKYNKKLLPTYNIFNETRYFTAGCIHEHNNNFKFKGVNIAFFICEDCWHKSESRRYPENPLKILEVNDQLYGECDLIITINASPSSIGKQKERIDLYSSIVKKYNKAINGDKIPEAILTKEPSAELALDQKDSNELPDYPLLDAILKNIIEGDLLSRDERIEIEQIFSEYQDHKSISKKINSMVINNEFKRRQAAPILRVQKRSFGDGRRMPIAQGYK